MSDPELFEHGYALVIGVDENALPGAELPTVAKDVKAVNNVLVHPQRCAYRPDNVLFLRGKKSNKDNILSALEWLKEKVDADPQATVVFYYSGHGHVDDDGSYYLIPYDFQGLHLLDQSAIRAEIFSAKLAAVQAPRTLIVLDCCHAEGMDAKALDDIVEVQRAPFPVDISQMKSIPDYTAEPGGKALDDLVDGQGRAVLNSSTEDQLSWIRKDNAMSLFTYHLIEGLTGHATDPEDSVVLVTDVMSWVQRNVKKSAERENRPAQTPVMRTDGVFPVAQSIGGQGVAKGLDGALPDPLAPLPAISIVVGEAESSIIAAEIDSGGGDVSAGDIDKSTTTFNQGGQTIGGSQVNIGEMSGDIDHIGDVTHDDHISVGSIGDNPVGIAIGAGSQATVSIGEGPGQIHVDPDPLFALPAALAAAFDPTLVDKIDEIKAQVALGSGADDDALANLILDLAEAAPELRGMIVALFSLPQISTASGPATKFALGRLD